ncbi:MAG: hypothetical protein KJ047_09765 [Anaerolineae bacterium]|mgnify:CR=1 FL=1|nr:hypothetical protein [Anaerolineae bacterium]
MSLTHQGKRLPARPIKGGAAPETWLVVQATALLQSVATANYACYGRAGVPRYPHPLTSAPPEGRATLCVEALLRDPAGEVALAFLDLDLVLHQQDKRQVVWSGYDPARHVQVAWVWDFYRILSHAVLRGAIPPQDDAPDAAWAAAVEALRAAGPDFTIEFRVRSACGDIHQAHRVERPAVAWSPDEAGRP